VDGLDKISARLLKDSVDVITPSLTNLQIIVNFIKMLILNTHPINRLSKAGAALVNTISSARRNGFFWGNFLLRISEKTQRERKCLFRKLHILISQTTGFHFTNYRFSFRKLQILISQTTDSHFANYRFSFRKLQISFCFVPFRFANYSKPFQLAWVQLVRSKQVCDRQSRITCSMSLHSVAGIQSGVQCPSVI